jgi:Family of unknown function (DUF5681)
MTKKKPVGYKMPPKKSQWQPGQSGNPSGKKKAADKPPQPLPEMFAAVFYEPATMTIAGKKQISSLGQVFIRTMLHNLVKAPFKQQFEAFSKLIQLGFEDLHKILSGLQEHDFDPFTEEHRRLLKIIQEEVSDGEIGE